MRSGRAPTGDLAITADRMRIEPQTPVPAMLAELGRRLASIRKQRGLTQDELAVEAGVGVATLRRIEDGRDARLGSWLRVMQALEWTAAVDRFLPEDFRSPLADARAANRRRRRPAAGPDFVWGDERS